jgi:hypothetical protein
MFSSYFNSIYSSRYDSAAEPMNTDLPNLDILLFDLPNHCSITVYDVFRGSSTLKNTTSISPDGISGLFLYNLRHTFAFLLWLLFKRSIYEGIAPICGSLVSLLLFLNPMMPL